MRVKWEEAHFLSAVPEYDVWENFKRMIIIYQANVWGSQHNGTCGKLANQVKSTLYNTIVRGGSSGGVGSGWGAPKVSPFREDSSLSERLQLATGKTAPRNTPLQPAVSDMAVSSPRYLKCGVNVYSHF